MQLSVPLQDRRPSLVPCFPAALEKDYDVDLICLRASLLSTLQW